MNIFLFHHAGGDKYFFREFEKKLLPHLEPISIEVPGRGDRFGEVLLNDMDSITEDVYQQIKPYINKPYMILGFSMGTLVAYTLMLKIRKQGKLLPKHVFLLGRESPDFFKRDIFSYKYSSKDFWNHVSKYGGLPEILLQNEEIKNMYEPILRADFQVLEEFSFIQEPKLPVSATILLGDEDMVKEENAQTWQLHFEPEIDMHVLKGGHFFLLDNMDDIARMIKSEIYND
jgi:medium-chain acyl-[acyl-carrier-protein] hydrolase